MRTRKEIGGVPHISKAEALKLLGYKAKGQIKNLRERGALRGERDAEGWWYPLQEVEALAERKRVEGTLKEAVPVIVPTPGHPPFGDLESGDEFENDEEPFAPAPPAIRPPAAPHRQLAGAQEWTPAMEAGYEALRKGHRASELVSMGLDPKAATTVLESFKALAGATTPVEEQMQQQFDLVRADVELFKSIVERVAHGLLALGDRVRSAEAAEASAREEMGDLRIETDALRVELQRLAKLVGNLASGVEQARKTSEMNQLIAFFDKSNADQIRLFEMAAERAGLKPPRASIGFDVRSSLRSVLSGIEIAPGNDSADRDARDEDDTDGV